MVKRFREARGDGGVLDNAGWKRAWVVVSGGIFVLMILFALKNPNVVDVSISNSSLDCVPGTYSESIRQFEDGFSQPAPAGEEDRAGQNAGTSPSDVTSVHARDERRATRGGQITTFTCTSYLGLIFALVAAALLSVGIAVMFWLAKWLMDFARSNARTD